MNPAAERNGKWAATAAIVLAFLAADFFTPGWFDGSDGPREYGLAFMLGVCIAQVNLTATWAALAPGNVALRLPWSLLLTVLMWYGLVLGNQCHGHPMRLEEALTLGAVLLGGVVIAQCPLWIAGRVFHWRLVAWNGTADALEPRRLQFHLGHLFVGTLLLSIALALGRIVLPPGKPTLNLDHELPVLLGAVVVCNLLITVPCIWGAFLKRGRLLLVAVGWLLYCAGVTVAEYLALMAFLGPPGPQENEVAIYFLLMNVVQCATVLVTLRIFRSLGMRLVRTNKPASPFAPGAIVNQDP